MSNRQGGVETVKLRNDFYADGFRSLLKVVVWEAIAIVVLVVALATVSIIRRDRLLAQSQDGRIIEPVTMDKPLYTDDWVLQWASTAVRHIMTFDFNDRKMRWMDNKVYFLDAGWAGFLAADKKSNLSAAVDQSKLVLKTAMDEAPLVTSYGQYEGKFYWQVQIPVLSTYEGNGGYRQSYKYLVKLTVMQVPLTEKAQGLGIFAFNSEERK